MAVNKIITLNNLFKKLNKKDYDNVAKDLEIIVRIQSTTLPTRLNIYRETIQLEKVIPTNEIVLTEIRNYGIDGMFCKYVPLVNDPDPGPGPGYGYGYFDPNFVIEIVDPKDKGFADLMGKYQNIKISHLDKTLNYSGMIGSDPEIFVTDNNKLVPAFHFLPDKHNPMLSPGSPDYNFLSRELSLEFGGYGGTPMYWDGFQAEFATKANKCLGHHIDSIAAGLTGVYRAARSKFKNAKLTMRNVFNISDELMDESDDEYVNFGCMPSFNIYGLRADKPPARTVPFRSAGGHIHFGIGPTTENQAQPIVKALDAICAVMCVSLFAEFDDPKRRILYGLPGEYRLPPHGLEYRPLSNAWLCHPVITNLVFDLARKALMFGKNGFLPCWKASEEETLHTIINCDVERAHAIMDRNKDIISKIFKSSYSYADEESIEMLFSAFKNGISSIVKDPNDLVSNWKLEGNWIPHSGSPYESCVKKLISCRKDDPEYKM